MLIQLENIAKFFPETDLFEGVCLQVNDDDRIGLVGPNGSGKTQLLGIIAGATAPESGKVNRRSRLAIGKLDQDVRADPDRTLLEEALTVFQDIMDMERDLAGLESAISDHRGGDLQNSLKRYGELKDAFERSDGYSYRGRTAAVLQGLGFSTGDLGMPCKHLSGGQINRLGLARLLLGRPQLLLLDEPTNHLDLRAVAWLESFLQSWEHAFIAVSHDRYFLDRVSRQVWEIANRGVSVYPGNYSRYQVEKSKRLEQQRREYENQRGLIKQTEEFIRRNIYGQKTKQAQSRRKMLEKLDRVERPSDDVRRIRLDLSGTPRSSETVLTVQNLAVGYGSPLVRFPFEHTFVRGDRVGVLGENGTGKTTLLRTLLGQIPPVSGTFLWGRNVSVGYFDQKMEKLSCSPIQELRLLDPLAMEGELRTFLARFGFYDDDVFKPLAALSGGEKNRLLLACLIYGRHNVLVLDEPTNHLDVYSREELESALEDYSGTVLVISHDRYFLDRIAGKILMVDGGSAELYAGNYSEWEAFRVSRRAREAERESRLPASRDKQPPGVSIAPRDPALGMSKNERFRLEKQLADLEREIEELERCRSVVEARLQCTEAGVSPYVLTRLAKEYEELSTRLDTLMKGWEEMGEKLG